MRELLLQLHIAAGGVALAAALVAAGTKALNLAHAWHVHSGRVFFAGMAAIFATAVPLSIGTGDVFLLLVALFSFYLAGSGWSYARNRRGTPHTVDWVRTFGMIAASGVMAAYGVHLLLAGAGDGVTLLVFAGIGAALSISDLVALRAGGAIGRERIARHLTMMLAGSIATVTAFVVVNFDFEPEVVLWLAPTVVITPFIVFWNFRIRGGTTLRGMPREGG